MILEVIWAAGPLIAAVGIAIRGARADSDGDAGANFVLSGAAVVCAAAGVSIAWRIGSWSLLGWLDTHLPESGTEIHAATVYVIFGAVVIAAMAAPIALGLGLGLASSKDSSRRPEPEPEREASPQRGETRVLHLVKDSPPPV